jgi:hypothetical protein
MARHMQQGAYGAAASRFFIFTVKVTKREGAL